MKTTKRLGVLTVAFAVLAVAGLDAQAKQKILIGTSGAPKPYVWVNEKNDLDGYDIAVLKEVNKLLTQYDFQFEKTEFPSIFAGIDSGRYQIGANNISKRPAREAKYLYAAEWYISNPTGLVVKQGRKDIKTVADLAGKKTTVAANGVFSQLFVEEYNKAHPDKKILVTYSDQDLSKTFQDVANGTIDFTFSEKLLAKLLNQSYGVNLDFVELPKKEAEVIQNPNAYFIYSKIGDGPKIQAAVDGALRTLKANGKLAELSQKYLEGDYTK